MAYQRVNLASLRTQLADRLKTNGYFWSQAEQDRAINEAVAVWQAMTGDHVITVTQTLTNTTSNLFTITSTDNAGTVLSVLRVAPAAGGASLREMSLYELDQGYYGWRTATASSTTQRPSYWSPVGINQLMIYPRIGATTSYSLLCYGDSKPLTSSSSDYIDIDEGELNRVLSLAQAILAFKEGVVEGTDNAKALREMFLLAATTRNKELTETALYKNYMGQDDSLGEPGDEKSQTGLRG
jgi:hypothetical protein